MERRAEKKTKGGTPQRTLTFSIYFKHDRPICTTCNMENRIYLIERFHGVTGVERQIDGKTWNVMQKNARR